jgi:single-strand DNA-binding protein
MHVGTFAGRVGRDAELKKLDSGRELLEFSLAVTVGWGDNKATEWIKATVWGDRAAKLAPYIKKGDALTITGRIRSRAYSAKDNSLKSEIACDVSELTMQGSRDAGEPRQESAAPAKAAEFVDDDLSDLPF